MNDFKEIWTQNSVNGPHDRRATVQTILRDDPLTQFDASLEEALSIPEPTLEVPDPDAPVLTTEMIDDALTAVSSSIFPHRALETQKLWMRRHMRKPVDMKYRLLQAKVLKMNKNLAYFPGGSAASRFNNTELLEILEMAIPQTWRSKFDLDTYVPSKHDRKRLHMECEAIERNEITEKPIPKKESKKAKKNGKGNKTSTKTKETLPLKYCSEHGNNPTHTSKECWTLHPELMPSKFKKAQNKKQKEKESYAMQKKFMEMFAMMQQSSHKRKASKSAKNKNKKRKINDSSDSEQSHCAMEMQTPEASDFDDSDSDSSTSTNMNKRIEKLGDTSE